MSLIHHTPHVCLSCSRPLKGRPDKKFCDPGCKNEYNNQIQRAERADINEIDLILKRNRRILKQTLGNETTKKIRRTEILQKGLRFDFYTHQYTNFKEDEYCFCYDFGYLSLDDDRCLIVKRRSL